MISWFKKHFIPHVGNDHKPHILRNYNLRNIVIIIIFIEAITFLLPTLSHLNRTGGMAAVLPAVLANLTNEERQAENLDVLTVSPVLNQAAEMKAEDMATKGYFAHISPDGKTPWYWLAQVGYQYEYAGENLAVDFTDSKDVTKAWMDSPTHRANIVKNKYTEVGTGIATGIYEGKETVFVAQVYANPITKTDMSEPIKKETKNTEVQQNLLKINTTSNVLGAETDINSVSSNTEKVSTLTVESDKKPTYIQKIFASPRSTTNIIFYIIFGTITLALLLYVVIKVKNYHMGLITNGLIILAILGAVLVVNYYLTHRDMVIIQSLDYSNINK